jgi:hypothetical protein
LQLMLDALELEENAAIEGKFCEKPGFHQRSR